MKSPVHIESEYTLLLLAYQADLINYTFWTEYDFLVSSIRVFLDSEMGRHAGRILNSPPPPDLVPSLLGPRA